MGLFALTLGFSALLLFWVEPIVAKMLLPKLGGTPVVWNTALVWYQAFLLFGYLYAHLLVRRFTLRQQVGIHGLVLVGAIVFLPLGFEGWSPPPETSPVTWMLETLTLRLALPYLALSASAPLFQAWFVETDEGRSADPYPLYAASNAGSVVALLSYPLLVQPNLRLDSQSWAWTLGFSALVLLVGGCAYLALVGDAADDPGETGTAASRSDGGASTGEDTAIDWQQRLRWIVVSAVPSGLILAVTTYLTSEVASIPLLWVLPLATYLVTFIVAFADRDIIRSELVLAILPGLLVTGVLVTLLGMSTTVWFDVVFHIGILFAVGLALHQELADTSPDPAHLTEFYLWLSFGGVVGGAFVALAAPVLFDTALEYTLLLVVTIALFPSLVEGGDGEGIGKWALFGIVFGAMLAGSYWFTFVTARPTPLVLDLVIFGAIVGLIVLSKWRPRIFVALLLVIAAGTHVTSVQFGQTMLTERTYFGLYSVRNSPGADRRVFESGNVIHGVQHLAESERRTPRTYFHPRSALGATFRELNENPDRIDTVGIVGLGIGSTAAYGRPGDRFVFYEIDPRVAEIARNREYFTYLSDSHADVDIVIGDGRLELEEQSKPAFDLLVLDAYSGGSIPVHLLTREAVQTYLSRLSPNGLIAFHITHKHLDLAKVVAAIASDLGLVAYGGQLEASKTLGDESVRTSRYVIVGRERSSFASLPDNPMFKRRRRPTGQSIWTDNYANLIEVYNWK